GNVSTKLPRIRKSEDRVIEEINLYDDNYDEQYSFEFLDWGEFKALEDERLTAFDYDLGQDLQRRYKVLTYMKAVLSKGLKEEKFTEEVGKKWWRRIQSVERSMKENSHKCIMI